MGKKTLIILLNIEQILLINKKILQIIALRDNNYLNYRGSYTQTEITWRFTHETSINQWNARLVVKLQQPFQLS